MGLPILKHPTFELMVPSTKQTLKYRPFLVKEEKILQKNKKIKFKKITIEQPKLTKIKPKETVSFFPDPDYLYLFNTNGNRM